MGQLAEAVHSHRRHVAIAALSVGLAAAPDRPALALGLAGVLAASLAAIGAPVAALIAAAGMVGGTALGAGRLEALEPPPAVLAEGSRLAAEAYLLESPRPSRFGSSAAIRVLTGPGAGARVLARADRGLRWPVQSQPGSELAVAGSVRRPRSSPGAPFDYAAHLRRRGIAAELLLERVKATGHRRGGAAGAVDRMRQRAEGAIAAGLPEEDAALARGMVLGQDERIDDGLRDAFRRSGLGHLLAVSGQNVMLLGAVALPLLAVLGLGLRARLAALLALIGLYVPLAGAGPSLQRAGVMGGAGIVALLASRPTSRWYALFLAAAVTLALNPRIAGDPGWQLSFAAVAGMLCLAPGLRRLLRALPRALAEAVAATVAATVATAPLVAHHFGSLPATGLPANLAALPAVAPVMWIGMLQTALGQLEPLGGPSAVAAHLLGQSLGGVAQPLLGYLAEVAQRFAEAPGADLRLPLPSPLAVGGAYAALGGAALVGERVAGRLEPMARERAAAWGRLPRRSRRAVLVLGTAVIALAAARLLAPPAPPDRLTISFLDVGQGDATLIQDGRGSAVLFDGGPPEARVVRLLRRAGVRRLSIVVATHASRDHHGGLREVIERYPVRLLLDGGDGSPDPDFRAVVAAAARRGVRRLSAVAPLGVRAGELGVHVLAPRPRPPGPAPEDPNPRAVAALVTAGEFDLFLSGDAESPSLLPLRLPDVDAMKVSHHGSADPGLPELLRRLRPQVAAIEVGRGNGYGHPTPSTLAALERAGVETYRTDRDGTVTLTVEGGRLRTTTAR